MGTVACKVAADKAFDGSADDTTMRIARLGDLLDVDDILGVVSAWVDDLCAPRNLHMRVGVLSRCSRKCLLSLLLLTDC